MDPFRKATGSSTATSPRRQPVVALASVLLVIGLLQPGCGASAPSKRPGSEPLAGGKGAVLDPELARGARLAQRFAAAYARSAYRRKPPPLPGAIVAVRRSLLAAAARVPEARHQLHPRARGLALQAHNRTTLAASVRVSDGRFPSFSVGFTVRRVGNRWRVIAISPPG